MMEKTGRLYGVGVGPGDPDLITVKGVKAIQSADIVAYHETAKQNSNALKIAFACSNDFSEKTNIAVC